jgi:hypothetical protein
MGFKEKFSIVYILPESVSSSYLIEMPLFNAFGYDRGVA